MRTLKFGGPLVPGDFIAVSEGNRISFGWYCGDGRGTLQYYYYGNPVYAFERYLQKNNNSEEGFTKKHFWKSYISAVHTSRVIKLNNPEEIFTDAEEKEIFEKSREVMIKLNFIKH